MFLVPGDGSTMGKSRNTAKALMIVAGSGWQLHEAMVLLCQLMETNVGQDTYACIQ